MNDLQTIPARQGIAVELGAGDKIKVINTHGTQVVDTWAFVRHDVGEFMSMEHTRATTTKMIPEVGECFVSTRRRDVIKLLEDTTDGAHDTLMAACDSYRYALLGCKTYHDNCTDNLHAALQNLGYQAPATPSPLNLFMNIPWTQSGALSFEAPKTKRGDFVVFEACLDVVMVFSACPQDILPVNGKACLVVDAHVQRL